MTTVVYYECPCPLIAINVYPEELHPTSLTGINLHVNLPLPQMLKSTASVPILARPDRPRFGDVDWKLLLCQAY
jgi:hypothetical protein